MRRRIHEDITDANKQTVFVKSGGVIQAGERKELRVDFGNDSSRFELEVRVSKNGLELAGDSRQRELQRQIQGCLFVFSVLGTISRADRASLLAIFVRSMASSFATDSAVFFGSNFWMIGNCSRL